MIYAFRLELRVKQLRNGEPALSNSVLLLEFQYGIVTKYRSRPRRANMVGCTPSICSITTVVCSVPLFCARDTRMPSNFSNSLIGDISNRDGFPRCPGSLRSTTGSPLSGRVPRPVPLRPLVPCLPLKLRRHPSSHPHRSIRHIVLHNLARRHESTLADLDARHDRATPRPHGPPGPERTEGSTAIECLDPQPMGHNPSFTPPSGRLIIH